MKRLLALVLVLALAFALSGCKVEKTDVPVSTDEEEEVDAQIPDDYEFLDDDEYGDYDDSEYDGEFEDEVDIPRTLEPAPAGSGVDYVISDALFASQMDEIAVYPDDFIGKTFSMIGYVLITEEENTQFAVVRDYVITHDEDIEHVDIEEDETFQTGIDCHFLGELPAEDAWVRVIGTLTEYDYVDDDGEAIPAVMLDVQSVEIIPETEGGSRIVSD